MSASYEDQIDELIDRAGQVPDGLARVAILEEAVRLADLHQRPDLGFPLRRLVIEASFFSGHPDRALVAFTWRLAQHDRAPGEMPGHELLIEYKWILVSCASFPQVSRDQLEDMLADMKLRYERAGHSLRPVHRAGCYLAMYLGEAMLARARYRHWKQAPRDALCEERADERSFMVQLHAYREDLERTVKLAQPLLRGGRRLAGIRGIVTSRILLPLVRLGRGEEAMEAHRQGYHLVGSNPYFLEEVSDHLRFLALAGQLDRAVSLFERHLPWALRAVNLRERLYFLRTARFLLERLEASHCPALRLRLPPDFAAYQADGRYETAPLLAWVDSTSRELSSRFDARNGNSWYSRQLDEAAHWHEWVTPVPWERTS